jgi:hypothetical protein
MRSASQRTRFGLGMIARGTTRKPEQLLQLYEFEAPRLPPYCTRFQIGGSIHGNTASLSPGHIDDLVAFLEML